MVRGMATYELLTPSNCAACAPSLPAGNVTPPDIAPLLPLPELSSALLSNGYQAVGASAVADPSAVAVRFEKLEIDRSPSPQKSRKPIIPPANVLSCKSSTG